MSAASTGKPIDRDAVEREFYAALAPHYGALFPLNQALARRVGRLLGSGAGAKTLLDLGSGGGQLAVHAAATAARVVAVDLSPEMVGAGAGHAKALGVPVIWRQGDLVSVARTIGERFDVVICVGNTLLHLPDRETVSEALRAIRRTLKVGGDLLIQTVNVDRCLAAGELELPVRRTELADGPLVLERRYCIDAAGELVFDSATERGGVRRRFRTRMVALAAKQLSELACQVGLHQVRLHGGYQDEPWSRAAAATVLSAKGRRR